MDVLPAIYYTIHVPLEWLELHMNEHNLVSMVYLFTENYAEIQCTYVGFTLTLTKCEAELMICDLKKIWWYRRTEMDNRPPNADYFPPLPFHETKENGDSGIEEE
ncbi:hypothetical protein PV327_011696 [Microctonus hyperodae]|uniref:Uncharacterized protein n=1 Tax=Microctonus hyperodae TaxID=165561 RepID=A0AA39C3I4_MICHY|nr:hypothetical protein PV327_011696 [Microctonus hyperodae]